MADSLLDLIVKRATSSVIPQAKQGYDLMADQVDPGPSLSDADHPYKAMARGGFAGILNGLGQLADQTTSPLGLASIAAGPARGIMGRMLSAARPAAAVAGETPAAASGLASAARTAAPVEDQLFLENMRRQQTSNRLSPIRFGQIPPTREDMVNFLASGEMARGR